MTNRKSRTRFRNFNAISDVRKCDPITLDTGNIRFMRIFPGVHWRGGIIENVYFKGFWTLRLRQLRKWDQHDYIVLFSPNCRLSTDPKIHDLEWPFYVQFSLLSITNRVSAIRLHLHIYHRAIYRSFFLYDVTSRDVRKRTVIRRILRFRERTAELS